MKILLDVDGVLADFTGGVLKLVGKPNVLVDRWDFHDQLDMTAQELWHKIDAAGHQFWACLDKLPWADGIINLLEDLKMVDNTILCTSPSLSYGCNSGKVEWIHENFSMFDRRFIITPCKHLICSDQFLLIDDSDDNVRKAALNHCNCILFPQRWNGNASLVGKELDYVRRQLIALRKESYI